MTNLNKYRLLAIKGGHHGRILRMKMLLMTHSK